MNRYVTIMREALERYVPGYFTSAAIGASARALGLGSQILVLILMGRILPKSAFGDAMLAFTIYRLVSYAVGSGLGGVLIYHVARRIDDTGLDIRLTRSVTLVTGITTAALALTVGIGANVLADLFHKPELELWLQHMAPLVLFGSLLQVTASSLDARSRVTRSIAITEVAPNFLRLSGMGVVALLHLPPVAVAHVFWLAVAVPWIFDAARLLSTKVKGVERLTLWDMRYAFWLALYPLLGMQLQGIDMIVVGMLFSSSAVAEYAIASRLATLFPFLQQMVVRVFTPRSGPLFQSGDLGALNFELANLRRSSLVSTAAMSALILFGSPMITALMGDYSAGLGVLVALAIPPVIRSAFVGIEVVLKMRGHGGAMALISGLTALIIVVGAVVLHPIVGLFALPISMSLSAITINAAAAYFIKRSGIEIAEKKSLPIIASTVVALSLVSVAMQPLYAPLCAAVVLSGVATWSFLRGKPRVSIQQ